MAEIEIERPDGARMRLRYAEAPPLAVWLGTLGMVLGRLEVFSLLVLLTPQFWRE